MTLQQQLSFDLDLGREAKREGMDHACKTRQELLDAIREALRIYALGQPERTATADDAARILIEWGYTAADLGPAMGSLFREGWTFTGRWRVSNRVSNHARMIRIWRLK